MSFLKHVNAKPLPPPYHDQCDLHTKKASYDTCIQNYFKLISASFQYPLIQSVIFLILHLYFNVSKCYTGS